jgi:hypothetical protein
MGSRDTRKGCRQPMRGPRTRVSTCRGFNTACTPCYIIKHKTASAGAWLRTGWEGGRWPQAKSSPCPSADAAEDPFCLSFADTICSKRSE